MFLIMPQASTLQLLLHRLPADTRAGLEHGQIDGIAAHQRFRHADDVGDQHVEQIERHALADDDPQDLRLLLVGRERVVGDDVLLRPEQGGQGSLLDVGVILLEAVGEAEGHHGQTGVVIRARLPVLLAVGVAEFDVPGRLQLVHALGAVDVAHALVPSGGFQAFGQEAGVGEAVLHDGAVAVEAEVDEEEVLGDDLGAGAGEVEGVGFLGAAEVVELEDEVLGQVGLVPPDDPSYSSVDQSELVSRCVDGLDTR